MTSPQTGSPTDLLRYLINSRFNVFLDYESDRSISSSGAVVVTLIRSIFSHNPRSIRTALNRIDGQLPKQVNIVTPKVFFLYPNATLPSTPIEPETIAETAVAIIPPDQPSKPVTEMTIREATRELAKLPLSVTTGIMRDASKTTKWFENSGENEPPKRTPYLKSVIAAHFLQMAAEGIPDVVEDFFDSIDGKMVETVKLGDDIFITNYSLEAPPGAFLSPEGIPMIEATSTQNTWGEALKGKKNNE